MVSKLIKKSSFLRSYHKYFFVLPFVLLMAGCEKVFDEKDDFTISTELTRYSRGDMVKITITNNSSSAIYYRRCGANNFRHRLVRLNENAELEITSDACYSFNQMIIEVRDGQSSELIIPLNFELSVGQPLEGKYQFEITLTDAMNQVIVPPKNKSNSFEVQ